MASSLKRCAASLALLWLLADCTAFNRVYSSKVVRAILSTRGPPRDRRKVAAGGSKARCAFLMRRIDDDKIKMSELKKVAHELRGLLTEPRDFTRVVKALGSRGLHPRMLDIIQEMDQRVGPSYITYSAAIASVSGPGSWELATKLLRQLEARSRGRGEGPNLITYNAVIHTLAQDRKWQEALQVFGELTSKEFSPTESTYSAAMSACKLSQWEVALHLNEDMLDRGLRGNLLTWTSLIQALGRAEPVLAIRAFGRMKRAGFQPDQQVFDAVLRACAAGGLWKRAIFIINKMMEAGESPSASAYSSAVAACAARQGRRSILLFEEMLQKGLLPTPAAYVGVMAAHAHDGRWDRVLRTFSEMRSQPGPITYAAYAAAMRAINFYERSPDESDSRKRGMARKQLKMFTDMLKMHKTQPDAECHSIAARAYADCYEAVKGTRLIEQALQNGHSPHGSACSAILQALPQSRDGQISDKQLKLLFEAGITGYLKESPSDSVRLLREMQEAKLEVSQEIYQAVVCESEEPDVAAWAYEEMRRLNMTASADASVAAMQAFAEDWERALEIFDELKSSGALALRGKSLDLLEKAGLAALTACAAGGRCLEAQHVLEEVRFQGLALSPPLYEQAIAASSSQLDTARNLVGRMLAAGYQPSHEALAVSKMESAIDQLQAMEDMGFVPDEATVRAAIGEARHCNDRELARELSLRLRVEKTGAEDVRLERTSKPKRPGRGDKPRKPFRPKSGQGKRSAASRESESKEQADIQNSEDWQERVTYF
ncbi:unnamed protein product [Effrenium voratum]|uniref:Pentatricopeptide repeat-containing protein n=1 Tax=Effrenium voratum TaxID=2562239 RepID=A0AA36MM18_9DINO|nr:unnamed protein product [Effrenium voratum]CAJ1415484.1 unnamed protein product [Effrenium voratum]